MPCYSPMQVYRSRSLNENGKRPISFSPNGCYSDMRVTIPCGKCIGCRLEKSRQWAIRCMHELGECDYSEFLTLTYDDENIPEDGQLRPSDMTNFIKRLRNFADPLKIRYIQCGEYGEETLRPHHHMIMFGYEFPDKELLKKNDGNDLFTSVIANGLWNKGYVVLGRVTFESCAYVARYVVKKQMGLNVEENKIQPYITMSRRPGIGMKYFKKYHEDIYNTDSVIIRGKEMLPPKAYDDKYAEINPKKMRKVKAERMKKNEQESYDRLSDIALCKIKKQKGKKRNETTIIRD